MTVNPGPMAEFFRSEALTTGGELGGTVLFTWRLCSASAAAVPVESETDAAAAGRGESRKTPNALKAKAGGIASVLVRSRFHPRRFARGQPAEVGLEKSVDVAVHDGRDLRGLL